MNLWPFRRATAPDPIRTAAQTLSRASADAAADRRQSHKASVMSNVTAIRAYVNKTRPGVLGEKARGRG